MIGALWFAVARQSKDCRARRLYVKYALLRAQNILVS
jgi:hypothetical protein